jgi:prepilin-type N-terminal cleavage/methylation domain-containing protein
MNWKIKYNYHQNGFTLIELAVVMIIIGLIIGGVMLGHTMVKSANIRSVMAQVEQFKTASNTFKTKYNCMAGDCANATSLLSGTANGNGNYRFDGGGARHTDNEVLLFWQHLSYAQLIPGNYTTVAPGAVYVADINFPSSKLGGNYGVWDLRAYNSGGAYPASGKLFPANYNNNIILGKPWGDTSSKIPLVNVMSGYDALEIDTKFDDGLPAYGNIITWMNTSGYSGGCPTSDTPATAIYTKTNNITCSLFFLNAI